MSLLAPLFLLGVLAVALPLWLHRLQTQSSERQPFSSAMLLQTAEQQVHVRKKLKYLLLLAARIALLVLLALAFAKPFMTVAPNVIEASDAGTHLVVVDTSASMGRAGVFAQAQAEARRALDDAPDDALLQLLAADSSLRVSSALGNDRSAPDAAVSRLAVSALRLDFGEAMTAVERFARSVPPPVTVHFVSDFQQSAMPARFADLVPAGVVSLVPHVVGTGAPFNWSVDYVRVTADGVDVGLNGSGDRERLADIELLLNGTVIESRGTSQTGPQALRFAAPGYAEGENRLVTRIVTDDDFAADNTWYEVVDNEPPAAIPLITLNSGGLPAVYLSAAIESAGTYRVEPLLPGDFDTRVLARYRLLLVDDIGLADAPLAAALTAYLQNGGNVLAFAGERATALESLPVSGHRHSAAVVQAAPGTFQSIGQIDAAHPALVRTAGWQNVKVTRSMPLELLSGDQALIRLENNEPFLIERRIGAGRLLLVPAALDNRWNDLPVRPVFVSFVIEAARYLSGINEIAKTYTTGASLALNLAGSSSGQVIDPDGNTILSLADTTREQQIKLDKPGFYEVYTSQGEAVVAANIDSRESDLRTISQDVLDRWRDATTGQANTVAATFRSEQQQTLELWHWLLLIVALVAIVESILGNMHLTPQRTERA